MTPTSENSSGAGGFCCWDRGDRGVRSLCPREDMCGCSAKKRESLKAD